MARVTLANLRSDLPQGVWQDDHGFLYSTDKRAGTAKIRNGHAYHRTDECLSCGGRAVVTWVVDIAGGTFLTTCLEACDAPDADVNPNEPF